MRTAIAVVAVAVLSLAGCHKSYKSGFKKLGSNVAAVGKGAASIARKIVPIRADVKVDVAAIAKTQVRQQLDNRIAAIEPISINKSITKVDRGGSVDEVPAQMPEPVITRTVDTSGDQVWKNMVRAGEKATCEKVASFDSCQATCSEHLRGESMRQLDPKAGKPVQCECTQGYSKCQ